MCGERAFLSVEHPADENTSAKVHLFPLAVMVLFNMLAFAMSMNYWVVQGQVHDSLLMHSVQQQIGQQQQQPTAGDEHEGAQIDVFCPADATQTMNSCLKDAGCEDTHTIPCKEYFDAHCRMKVRLAPGFVLFDQEELRVFSEHAGSGDSEFTLTVLVLISFLAMIGAFGPAILGGMCDD